MRSQLDKLNDVLFYCWQFGIVWPGQMFKVYDYIGLTNPTLDNVLVSFSKIFNNDVMLNEVRALVN